MRVLILGGGIAGFAAALAARKAFAQADILLFEKEDLPFIFASSRNAAIARSYESDPVLSFDVKKSIARMLDITTPDFPLLQKNGLLLKPLEYDYYEDIADFDKYKGLHSRDHKVTFADGSSFQGKLLEQNGILDIHLLQQHFLQQAKLNKVQQHLKTLATIKKIENENIKEISINQEKITLQEDDLCIVAAGSWSRSLLTQALPANEQQFVPPLIPHKRHLFFLHKKNNVFKQENVHAQTPILWDEAREFYVRHETGGLLATHGDQTPCAEDDFNLQPTQLESFEKSAVTVFPWLEDYAVARYWACLRTFTLDGRPLIGFDPLVKNLFWLAGLGGRGMSISLMLPTIAATALKNGYKEEESEQENPYSLHRFV